MQVKWNSDELISVGDLSKELMLLQAPGMASGLQPVDRRLGTAVCCWIESGRSILQQVFQAPSCRAEGSGFNNQRREADLPSGAYLFQWDSC